MIRRLSALSKIKFTSNRVEAADKVVALQGNPQRSN